MIDYDELLHVDEHDFSFRAGARLRCRDFIKWITGQIGQPIDPRVASRFANAAQDFEWLGDGFGAQVLRYRGWLLALMKPPGQEEVWAVAPCEHYELRLVDHWMELARRHELLGRLEEAEAVWSLRDAFMLRLQGEYGEWDDGKPTFGPVWEMDGVASATPAGWPERKFETLMKWATSSQDPVVKARLLHVVFECGRSKADARKAIVAEVVETYLKAAEVWTFVPGCELDELDTLDCAAELSCKIRPDLIESVSRTILERAGTVLKAWLTEPKNAVPLMYCRILVGVVRTKQGKSFANVIYAPAKELIRAFADAAGQKKDFFLRQHALKLLSDLECAVGGTDQARQADGEKLKTMLEEADMHRNAGSHMIAAIFTGKALAFAMKIGASDRIEEIKKMAVKDNENAMKAGEFKTFTGQVEVPTEAVERAAGTIGGAESLVALGRVLRSMKVLITRSEAEARVKKIAEKAPFQALVPKVAVRDNRPVAVGQGPDSLLSLMEETTRYFLLVNGFLVNPGLEKWKEEHPGAWAEIANELAAGLVPNRRLRITERGFRAWFEGDWAGALHLLVPALEGAIRARLEAQGVDTLAGETDGTIKERTLGGLLGQPKAKEILGEDFHWMALSLLTEEEGLNLRNRVCHGQLKDEEATAETCLIVVALFACLLATSSRET